MTGGTDPAQDQAGSASKNRWQRLPTWAKWTIGVVAALFLMGIGAAIGGGNHEDKLKDEVATVKSELRDSEAETEAAEEEAETVVAEEGQITKEAKSQALEITEKAKSEASSISGKVSGQRNELAAVEGELSDAESSLLGVQEEKAKSSITDGTWQAEADYIPGTYEAPGGGGCYWALLSEPGGGGIEGIIENGGFNKHQILNITSPYFETRECGTWHRVG